MPEQGQRQSHPSLQGRSKFDQFWIIFYVFCVWTYYTLCNAQICLKMMYSWSEPMGSLQEDGGREAPNVRISAVVGSAVNPQQLGPLDTILTVYDPNYKNY